METLLLIVGVVSFSVLIAVIYTVFLSEDARGRRRYGAERWAQMKEAERIKREKEEEEERRRQEEAERIRRLQDEAVKLCPICGTAMVKEIVLNISTDRCPQKHGVWLDHDELEVIAEIIEEDAEAAGESSGFATGMLLGMVID